MFSLLLKELSSIPLFAITAADEARWPSGRASDSGVRGGGSVLTHVAVLYP